MMKVARCLRPVEALFRHPHYPSGVVIARLLISVATFIWSVLVLTIDDALMRTPYGKNLRGWGIDEDYVAVICLVISLAHLYCIIRPCRPQKLGILGYSLLLFGWMSIFLTFTLVRPVQVTGITMSFVVVALAFFAVVGGPRRKYKDAEGGPESMVG